MAVFGKLAPSDGAQTTALRTPLPPPVAAAPLPKPVAAEEVRSLALAERANEIAFSQAVSAGLGTLIGFFTLVAAVAAALYARRAAVQARRSADIARDAFVAGERAWINIELALEESPDFSRDGGTSANVAVKVSNIGKTPAINVHTNVAMTLSLQRAPGLLRDLAERSRHADPSNGRLLLPGVYYHRPWSPSVDPLESGNEWGQASVLPMIVVCVTYQTLPDMALHQTAECFMVGVKSEHSRFPSSFQRGAFTPLDQTMIQGWSGGFAD
jgi:uncharacterized membrane protein YphA (DoxX/SURF4 family)